MTDFPHIDLPEVVRRSDKYKSTAMGRSNYPERDRVPHADRLLLQYDEAYRLFEEKREEEEVPAGGFYLDVEGQAGKQLKIGSLVSKKKNARITQQTVTVEGEGDEEVIRSTVFVSDEAKGVLSKKINDYRNRNSKGGNPQNNDLVRSIECIRLADGKSLWKGRPEDYPVRNPHGCELWIALEEGQEVAPVQDDFFVLLDQMHINHSDRCLAFSQRIVFLASVNAEMIERLMYATPLLCEVRPADVPCSFFENQERVEQREWIDELVDRVEVDRNSGVAVSLLDEGVTSGHPLLSPVIGEEDCDTIFPDRITSDIQISGHGTVMAGTILYEDVVRLLESTDTYHIPFELLSVKIWPNQGQNNPDLYGDITRQAVSRSEILKPEGKVIYCMATTAIDEKKGKPSSWSAAVDALCCGREEETEPRLMLVSAGNQEVYFGRNDYPEYVKEFRIHNPAQAYNAVTVGAYTEKMALASPDNRLLNAPRTAPSGGISPFSTSSLSCHRHTPLKPEVVFEGGNTYLSDGANLQHDDLSLLSCNADFQRSGYFNTNRATSCATALAANFAARLQARYPDYWPETIRALMVHSARWTEAMERQFPATNKTEMAARIRVCGYGVPQEGIAFHSHENAVTYVSQSAIQPYRKGDGSSAVFNEIQIFQLPWPKELLLNLGEREASLRVTLSYFIEPNPGEGGGHDRYTYASCGLRFETNKPGEDLRRFQQRVNLAAREQVEEDDENQYHHTNSNWAVGTRKRSLGSVQSDFMTLTAAEMSDCSYIAVWPVTGWWKFYMKDHSYKKSLRYALVVSLEVDDETIDLYTPVRQMVEQLIRSQVPINII